MAIRLRIIDDEWKALCAAESENHPDDIYLDDAMHRALSIKFMDDFESMGFIREEIEEEPLPLSPKNKVIL